DQCGDALEWIVVVFVAVLALSVFFFFSSRRRHTRWPRDWSSDVCSSDLGNACRLLPEALRSRVLRAGRRGTRRAVGGAGGGRARSEERRVGKECRSRGSAGE